MESKETVALLTEIRDELRKTNERIEWLENIAKEEMAKDKEPINPKSPTWKSYIPLTIALIAVLAIVYYSKQ